MQNSASQHLRLNWTLPNRQVFRVLLFLLHVLLRLGWASYGGLACVAVISGKAYAQHSSQERNQPHCGLPANSHVCQPWLLMCCQAVTLALKGMEAKHAAERQLQEQRLVSERNRAAKAAEAADAAVSALRVRIAQLKAALADLSTSCYSHGCGNPGDKGVVLDRDSASGSRGGSSSGGSSSGAKAVPLLQLSAAGSNVELQQQGLAAGPASRPVLAVGERWLYAHLPDGPWRRARHLLQQQTQEGLEGMMRQSGSGEHTDTTRRGSQTLLAELVTVLNFPTTSATRQSVGRLCDTIEKHIMMPTPTCAALSACLQCQGRQETLKAESWGCLQAFLGSASVRKAC